MLLVSKYKYNRLMAAFNLLGEGAPRWMLVTATLRSWPAVQSKVATAVGMGRQVQIVDHFR